MSLFRLGYCEARPHGKKPLFGRIEPRQQRAPSARHCLRRQYTEHDEAGCFSLSYRRSSRKQRTESALTAPTNRGVAEAMASTPTEAESLDRDGIRTRLAVRRSASRRSPRVVYGRTTTLMDSGLAHRTTWPRSASDCPAGAPRTTSSTTSSAELPRWPAASATAFAATSSPLSRASSARPKSRIFHGAPGGGSRDSRSPSVKPRIQTPLCLGELKADRSLRYRPCSSGPTGTARSAVLPRLQLKVGTIVGPLSRIIASVDLVPFKIIWCGMDHVYADRSWKMIFGECAGRRAGDAAVANDDIRFDANGKPRLAC